MTKSAKIQYTAKPLYYENFYIKNLKCNLGFLLSEVKKPMD